MKEMAQERFGTNAPVSCEAVEEWLISRISDETGIAGENIDVERPLRLYGLYSKALGRLTEDMGSYVGRSFPPTLIYDYPTIRALAAYAAGILQTHDEEEGKNVGGNETEVARNGFPGGDIAVVGMGCRFPGGCNSPEEFWEFLKMGGDGITEVPDGRWEAGELFDPDHRAPGKMNTRWGGFISDIDMFDASHFGITPREAQSMDVQQRLVLEVCWEALENAAEITSGLAGSSTGVFIGIGGSDYTRRFFEDTGRLDFYCATGSYTSIAANRVSYALGLRGPSISVDTACSSSLVSIHMACRSLLDGECGMALAGGVNAIVSPEITIALSKAKMMAPDGRCKTFDASADGYVRSEGCGIVVLKRLTDALRDKNNILCVIKGTSVNHSGKSNGLSAPSGLAQQEVIRGALGRAGIKPSEVQYVEAHGTGTFVGDPIEFRSLAEVMKEGRSKDKPLIVGTVKTNIGHTEMAAGVAGLIKVILSMSHGQIPPNLHLNELNPQISPEEVPAVIPTETVPWDAGQKGRIAGISSFGFGGVNAHIVVGEAPNMELASAGKSPPFQLLTISAKSENALRKMAERYADFLRQKHTPDFEDICFSAGTGRGAFPYRLALAANGKEDAARQLEMFLSGAVKQGLASGYAPGSARPGVAFLFTGQGSQYFDMGRELYQTQPVFAQAIDRCGAILKDHMEHSLISLLFDPCNAQLADQTRYTQPMLFALQYALAVLWQSWGVKPSAVMGHSVGEYAAACIGGVFTLEDGLKLIAARGRMMQSLPSGGLMAAVFAGEEIVRDLMLPYAAQVSIAAVNGPESVVISGSGECVGKIIKVMEGRGIRVAPLAVSHAFHSPLMEPMIQEFEKLLEGISFNEPSVPLISNVTGEPAGKNEICTARYWCEHIRRPVLFDRGIRRMYANGLRLFMEIGPNPVLCGMGRRCLEDEGVVWLSSLRKGAGDSQTMLGSMARLYCLGIKPLEAAFGGGRRVSLPAYPFERQRFWFNSKKEQAGEKLKDDGGHGMKGVFHPSEGRLVNTPYAGALYEYRCAWDSPYICQHRVYGTPVFPGAAMIAMVTASLDRHYKGLRFSIYDTVVKNPLYIEEGSHAVIHVLLEAKEGARTGFQVFSTKEAGDEDCSSWCLHLAGTAQGEEMREAGCKQADFSLPVLQSKCTNAVSGDDFYSRLKDTGLEFGEHMRWLDFIYKGSSEVLARVRFAEGADVFPPCQVHPGLLDAGAQLLLAAFDMSGDEAYMFMGYDSYSVYGTPEGRMWYHLAVRHGDISSKALTGDFTLFCDDGRVVAEAKGAGIMRVSRAEVMKSMSGSSSDLNLLHINEWVPVPAAGKQAQPRYKKWVIFSDNTGVGDNLAQLLEMRGARCIVVYASSRYKAMHDRHLSVNIHDPEDYRRLSEYIIENFTYCEGVVHLWSLNMSSDAGAHAEALEREQMYGPGSALLFLQQVLGFGLKVSPRFWFVTAGSQSVSGDEGTVSFAQASIWGFGKTFAIEHGELWGGLADIDPRNPSALQGLANEMLCPSGEELLAFRGGKAFGARLIRKNSSGRVTGALSLDSNATYLITGGTGGIGIRLAQWLALNGAGRLALLSRKGASQGNKDIIRKITEAGTAVDVFQADVADYEALKRVLPKINCGSMPLKGVFHLAGELDDGMLFNQSRERFMRALRPKAAGALNLHAVTRELPLDCFVMFSSVASVTGASGQGNYAAANAVMDSLAYYRRLEGLPALSVNWGPWEGNGMIASLSGIEVSALGKKGLGLVDAESGFAMLKELMESNAVQAGVFPLDAAKYAAGSAGGAMKAFFSRLSGEAPHNKQAALSYSASEGHGQAASAPQERKRPVKSAEGGTEAEGASISDIIKEVLPEQRLDKVMDHIRKRVAEAIWVENYEKIDVQQNLLEMGLDSLIILGLRSSLKTDFGVNIPFSEFLQCRTVKSLGELVMNILGLNDTLTEEPSSVQPGDFRVDAENRFQPFPLTDVQYAYWIGRQGQFGLGDVSCHVYVEVEVGGLDTERLNSAVTSLVKRHEMLRAVILPDGTQRILAEAEPYRVRLVDLRGMQRDKAEESLELLRQELSHAVHPSLTGPLFDITASRIDDLKTRLHISLDLLIADGWSFNILINDLYSFYCDPDTTLPKIEISYRDYIMAEHAARNSEAYENSLKYWRDKLASLPPAPELPVSRHPSELAETKFVRLSAGMDKDKWDRLKKKAAQEGLTPSGVLLAAFVQVIGRWSKSPRFTIMMTLFNRLPFHPQVNSLVGDFTSLIALAVDTAGERTFAEKARAVQKQFWEDMENRCVSGVQVLRELTRINGGEAQSSMPVVFTSVLPYGGSSGEETSTLEMPEGLPVDFVYCISQTPQVWIDFQIFDRKGALSYNWDIVSGLFPEGLPEDMFDAFNALLADLCDNEALWHGEEYTRLPSAQAELRKKVNMTEAPFPQKLLHELFLEQAEKQPQMEAVVAAGVRMTYGELAARAGDIGRLLASKGAGPNQLVAVIMEKGWEQAAGVMGILFSGAAYLPIDPAVPQQRLDYILRESEARIALTQSRLINTLTVPEGVELIGVGIDAPFGCSRTDGRSILLQRPEDLAYVIYTSGSTGMPKGVMISHSGAVNTVYDINQRFGVGSGDRVVAISSLNFDLSVYDIFGLLGAGGTVVFPSQEEVRDPACWHRLIIDEKITLWNSVPAFVEMLYEYVSGKKESLPSCLRLIMMSGDWIPVSLPGKLRSLCPGVRLISMGGATEASIWSIVYDIDAPGEVCEGWRSIPYGKPLSNQTFHVLNDALEPCPDWVPGHLYIGGSGLAMGYFKDQDKTSKSFFINHESGERLYSTGDLGRYLPDGNIEFLGREDLQVKIRGHRIELGEVEEAIRSHPGVRDAAVVVCEGRKGDKYLSAFAAAEDFSENPLFTVVDGDRDAICAQWGMAVEAGKSKAAEVFAGIDAEEFARFGRYLEDYAISVMGSILNMLGVFTRPFERYTADELIRSAGIDERYRDLMKQWLDALLCRGLVKMEGSCYTNAGALTGEPGEYTAAEDGPKSPAFAGYAGGIKKYFNELIKSCPGMLMGKTEPLQVFFGSGLSLSPELLLRMTPAVNELGGVAGDILKAIANAKGQGTVRVLELGARTGTLAKQLLELLPDYKISYTVSDSSPFFLDIAEENLKAFPNTGFKLMDMDGEASAQGFIPNSFDVVIANHSLHRAVNLPFTLGQVHSLLSPGGSLIMTELTQSSALQLVSVGILEAGFTRLTDSRAEKRQPLLSEDEWRTVICTAGFEELRAFPGSELKPGVSGRAVLLARSASRAYVFNEDAVRDHLRQTLPEYMLPHSIELLRDMPLTANGKVDRRALSQKGAKIALPDSSAAAPASECEEKLLDVWKEVLKVESAGIRDSFFELGGDSLVGTRMISKIRELFGVEISLRSLFSASTVELLAKHIEALMSEEKQNTGKAAPLPAIVPDVAGRYEPFPLTDVQQAYWLGRTGLFELGGVSTHSYFEIENTGLDVERLNSAWQRLIRQHDMMRTVVTGNEQRILKHVPPYEIKVTDLRGMDAAEADIELDRLREEMSHQVIQVDTWPLFDIRAALLYGDKIRLHVSFDNLIFDGWSMLYLFEEWARIYNEPGEELKPLELSFRDYVLAVEALENTGSYEEDSRYWSARIPQMPPAPMLPLAKSSGGITEQRFRRLESKLPPHMWHRLKEQAQNRNITPSGLLLAVYSEILGMWSRSQRFTVNLTLFNRMPIHPQVYELVGDFTSLTLLEVDNTRGETFSERAKNIQQRLWEDLDHSYMGGIRVLREYTRAHNANSRSAVMPVVFTSALGLGGAHQDGAGITRMGKLVYNITQTPQVWLDHQVYENDGSLVLIWDSVAGLFPEGLLEDMFQAYRGLLEELAENGGHWDKKRFSLLPPAQLMVRRKVNSTDAGLSCELLHTLFKKQARTSPDAPAVIAPDRVLTYGELYRRALYLGRILKDRGAEANTLVAVAMEKGWEQVAGVLGVLFSGAAYLPVDPELPKERLWYLLRHGGARLVLTQSWIGESIEWPGEMETIYVDAAEGVSEEGEVEFTQSPEDLAYVIFTSGSTGLPKGVMIDHRGAVNTVLDINRRFSVSASDRVLAVSNLNFDLSVYDIFGLLAAGGAIVMPGAGDAKNPSHWDEMILRHGVSIWNSVPALMQALTDNLADREEVLRASLRLVLMSGDWIPVRLPGAIWDMNPQTRVISLGGATEASIWSIVYPIEHVDDKWNSIPYGYPLDNQRFYVLNSFMEDCPDLVPGQLYIGGTGLAKGYWRDEEKTREGFILHPATGEALYRTGDVGRYMPDGSIEFLGRDDFQVKIRGYRIELGEIESALRGCGDVSDAVVLAAESKGEKWLIGFIIPAAAGGFDSCRAHDYLAERLPAYMIPSAFVVVESMPLTVNGKIDRKELLKLASEIKKSPAALTLPKNDMERLVSDIVKDVLGIDEAGTNENLFDMGANSMHMLRIQGRLENTLGRKISIMDIFEHTSIGKLADFLNGGIDEGHAAEETRQQAERRRQMQAGRKKRKLRRGDRFER